MLKLPYGFADDSADISDFDVVFYCVRFREVDTRCWTHVDALTFNLDLDRWQQLRKVLTIDPGRWVALFNHCCVLIWDNTRLCSRLP